MKKSTPRFDVLNQAPLTAVAMKEGAVYVAVRNGVHHELRSCAGGWLLERSHERSKQHLGHTEFFSNLEQVQKTVGAFAALPVFIKLGIFKQVLAKPRQEN
jgi:hypothetical protein